MRQFAEVLACLAVDLEQKAAIAYGQSKPVRSVMPGGKCAYRLENVVLDEIEDGDAPLLLDIGVAPQDRRLVELDMDDARIGHAVPRLSQMQQAGASELRDCAA